MATIRSFAWLPVPSICFVGDAVVYASRGPAEAWPIGGQTATYDLSRDPGAPPPATRVLVVEDELMIRMLLEDMLGELGYTVAAEAGRIEEALDAAKTADFDVAILDVNLNGETPVRWPRRSPRAACPFVFATGYGEHGLPEAYRDRPTLKKPFQLDGLSQLLQSALAGRRARRLWPNTSASLVMNGSSVMSRRSGVTAMRLSASAEMSVPSAGGWPRMRT